MNPKIAAIVPMRHSSERVPGKNYRNFAGTPLFFIIMTTLKKCKNIDQIIIDTDSPIIIEKSKENFPDVLLLKRPKHLCDGNIPMNDVLENIVKQVDADFYLQTHSTNPLLKSYTIEAAIQSFISQLPIYDSLFSVTLLQSRLWDQLARPINHNPDILLRTQDLPPTYEENSCIYLFTKDLIINKRNRIGNRPLLFPIDPLESWDIDMEIDFKIAEFLFNLINKEN